MFDMKSWYLSTEELFFANWDLGGNFWSDPVPKSFTEYDPINYVDKWNTPIMIIHGAKDFRVPYNQGMEAFQAAKLKGIPSRFLLFPDEGHWVLSPQNSMVWHTEFYRWLDTYLKD
jgi:dipeptidyl aminopeptidase/acylaminoacyl peptidase